MPQLVTVASLAASLPVHDADAAELARTSTLSFHDRAVASGSPVAMAAAAATGVITVAGLASALRASRLPTPRGTPVTLEAYVGTVPWAKRTTRSGSTRPAIGLSLRTARSVLRTLRRETATGTTNGLYIP